MGFLKIQRIVAYMRQMYYLWNISFIRNAANYMAALWGEFFITSQRMNYVYNRACGRFTVLPRINIPVCTRVKMPDVCTKTWQFSRHLNRTRLWTSNKQNLVHTKSIKSFLRILIYIVCLLIQFYFFKFKIDIRYGYKYKIEKIID